MQISKIDLRNNAELDFIKKLLAPHTKRVYLVGGCVRDLLLGLKISDFDLEIYDLSFEKFEALMNDIKANGVGKSFFVFKYKNFDLSLARYENKISKGHKGFEVRICNDEKQACKRRDFTINSMMINIFTNEFLDFYEGFSHLQKKLLKHIDDNSFKEDSLRILRAVHFVSRFDLQSDTKTLALMQSVDISDLSLDRINAELYKFFKAKNLLAGFLLLQNLNLEERLFYHKSNDKAFLELLEKSREFVRSEALFLYLYLNFFNINKNLFFKKTKIKNDLHTASKQVFVKENLTMKKMCEIALSMPLKEWLGLWSEERIALAKKLKLYGESLKIYVNMNEAMKLGLKGAELGLYKKAQEDVFIKNYIKGFADE